jgi:hypothetical protein
MDDVETISELRRSQRLAAQQAIAANINEDQPNIEVEPEQPRGADPPPINAKPAAINNPIKPDELDPEDPPEPEPDMADPAAAGAAGAFALTPAAAHQNILDYTFNRNTRSCLTKQLLRLKEMSMTAHQRTLKVFSIVFSRRLRITRGWNLF